MSNIYDRPSKSASVIVESAPPATRIVQPVAEERLAAKLVSFQVSTDSVVATAKLVFDNSHSHISLHWGDDSVEEINLAKLRQQSKRPGDLQEPNALELQHIYRSPHDHGRKIILARTRSFDGKNTWDHAVVDIVQRYSFKFYPFTLSFSEHLDAFYEQHSEMEVRLTAYQGSNRIHSGVWVDEIVTNPNIGPPPGEDGTPDWRVGGSGFAKEISYSDEPIYINLDILEFDGPGKYGKAPNIIWDFVTTPLQWLWWVAENIPFEFDTSNVTNPFLLPLEVHPRNLSSMNGKRYTQFRIPYEGKILIEFDLEMKLIIPINKEFRQNMTVS